MPIFQFTNASFPVYQCFLSSLPIPLFQFTNASCPVYPFLFSSLPMSAGLSHGRQRVDCEAKVSLLATMFVNTWRIVPESNGCHPVNDSPRGFQLVSTSIFAVNADGSIRKLECQTKFAARKMIQIIDMKVVYNKWKSFGYNTEWSYPIFDGTL